MKFVHLSFLSCSSESDKQNQLLICLHLLLPISGHMKLIWEDFIQSKSMHTKCKEGCPPNEFHVS